MICLDEENHILKYNGKIIDGNSRSSLLDDNKFDDITSFLESRTKMKNDIYEYCLSNNLNIIEKGIGSGLILKSIANFKNLSIRVIELNKEIFNYFKSSCSQLEENNLFKVIRNENHHNTLFMDLIEFKSINTVTTLIKTLKKYKKYIKNNYVTIQINKHSEHFSSLSEYLDSHCLKKFEYKQLQIVYLIYIYKI